MNEPATASELAQRQLDAYNSADIDAFCACYAEDVVVLDADGNATMTGLGEFRERYAALFARFKNVRAELVARLACGAHAVDHERWSRIDAATGEASSGEILARYTVKDGRIEIQGDQRDRLATVLESLGYRVKRVGG